MGTRADFYVGRGLEAEWIGSIAWDGYPSSIPDSLRQATSVDQFRAEVTKFFEDDRDDVTLPERGWPWPWDTSSTTDWSYAIDGDKVFASCFGHPWVDAATAHLDRDEDEKNGDAAVFPNMTDRKNVRMDAGSGLIVITRK